MKQLRNVHKLATLSQFENDKLHGNISGKIRHCAQMFMYSEKGKRNLIRATVCTLKPIKINIFIMFLAIEDKDLCKCYCAKETRHHCCGNDKLHCKFKAWVGFFLLSPF